MKDFRKKALVAMFFAFISLGQAYPLATAWAMPAPLSKAHRCCMLKPTDEYRDCRCEKKKQVTKAKQDKKSVCLIPKPCNSKTRSEIVNFQSDPFL